MPLTSTELQNNVAYKITKQLINGAGRIDIYDFLIEMDHV